MATYKNNPVVEVWVAWGAGGEVGGCGDGGRSDGSGGNFRSGGCVVVVVGWRVVE